MKCVLEKSLEQPFVVLMVCPKNKPNKTDKSLSVYDVMSIFVNTFRDKAKTLKESILKDIVPCWFNSRTEEIQRKHQQVI